MQFFRGSSILLLVGSLLAGCQVPVDSPKRSDNSPTGVSLSQTSLELVAGGATSTLSAAVVPQNANQRVIWSSSSTFVATVSDKGVVTPKATGTSTITVSTAEGGLTATCQVVVVEQGLQIESQAGILVGGVAGSATFAVTTAEINSGTVGNVVWHPGYGSTVVMEKPAWVSAAVSATADNSATVTVAVDSGSVPGTYYFSVNYGAARAWAILTISEPLVPVAELGYQDGTISAGIPGSSTFSVTTLNVEPGTAGTFVWYTSVDGSTETGAPAGVVPSVTTISSGKATATMTAGTATAAGVYYFRLSEGTAATAVRSLAIEAPSLVFYAQTQTGTLKSGSVGSATFQAGTSYVPNGAAATITWYTSVAGTTPASPPAGITATVTAMWSSLTVTMTTDASVVFGNYYCKVAVGTAVSPVLTTSVSPNWSNIVAAGDGITQGRVSSVFVSGSTIYVGAGYGLSVSTNGGVTWAARAVPDIPVQNVMVANSKLYAATMYAVYTSTDDGASWSLLVSSGGGQINDVAISGTTIAVAVCSLNGFGGGVILSADGGATWTTKALAAGLGSVDVWGVAISGSSVYAATSNGLAISTNGGATFTNYKTANGLGNNIVADVFVSGGTIYAATLGGLSISTDGTSFSNRTTANGLGSNTVADLFVAGGTIYAATTGGLSISTDGTTFMNYKTSAGLLANDPTSVFVSGSTIYVGTSAGLSVSTTAGASWTNYTKNADTTSGLGGNYVQGVFVVGSTIYAATGGGLSISTNGGTSWTNQTSNGLVSASSVYVSGSTIYVGTTGSGVAISTNGGTSWTNYTTVNGLGHNNVTGIAVSGGTIYASTEGGVSISTNGGTSWTNRTTSSGLGSNMVKAIAVSGSTVVAACYPYGGSTGGLSVSTNGGASYTNYTTSSGLVDNYAYGVGISGSTVYVGTMNGLSVFANGNTWTQNLLVNSGIYGLFVSGSAIAAATSFNGLYLSFDGGLSWINSTTASGLGNNAVNTAFVSGSTMYAATSGGLSIGH